MFWISAAHEYCAKENFKHIKLRAEKDPHPPQEFRIIGTFSNTPEFSNDFNCPIDSYMNPKNKCTVW